MSDPSDSSLKIPNEDSDIVMDPTPSTPQPQPLTLEPAASSPVIPTSALIESSSTIPQSIPTSPTANTMSSAPVEIPTFTPYIPNTGVNGRRASSSGKGANGQHRSVGPELSTPSKLSQASGGSFIPTGEPPYEPPYDIVYPPDKIPNPHWGDMTPQPIIENFPANSLYRPKYLPADIDDRLDKKSVWIGVEKESARAVYFLPPTCQCCKNPAVAQHCDRGWPNCARCIGRGVTCIPGKAWGMMRPKGKRRNLKAEIGRTKLPNEGTSTPIKNGTSSSSQPRSTPSSSAKGKGKAVQQHHSDFPTTNPDLLHEPMNLDQPMSTNGGKEKPRKKRRLSGGAGGEIGVKRIRRKSHRDSTSVLPHTSKHPLSPADRQYFSRLEANAKKPPLTDMHGPCPVWAKTRGSLHAACEYLRNPKTTAGASVEIGVGGIARGVILEGDIPDAQGAYWGMGKDTGTIITAIGPSRKQKSDYHQDLNGSDPPAPISQEPLGGPLIRSFTPLNIFSPSQSGALAASTQNQIKQENSTVGEDVKEAPEVEALLMANRARTPVALAVAQDYTAVPFKVPRPFIVLGWFWITDAWPEPVMPEVQFFHAQQNRPIGPPESVIWKFRFEWCTGGSQGVPWWSSVTQPTRPTALPPTNTQEAEWQIAGSGCGSTTVQSPSSGSSKDVNRVYQYICPQCKHISTKVYRDGDICLNERCPWFFGDASSLANHIGPFTNIPFPLLPRTRVLPETLGLQLRPPEPSGISHDITQSHAGREFWRGWVCHKCGSAQERYKWAGWSCEACGHSVKPPRRIYTAEELRPPSRPVCTSTRQDDGYASIPFEVNRSWSLFDNNIKVIKHSLEPLIFGSNCEVHHILAHEGQGVNSIAGDVLKKLQMQGEDEIPMRRYTAVTTQRPAELTMSLFYTYLCGSESYPINAFPTYRSAHWSNVPPVCLEIVDLINDRSGKCFPGEREFDSLLIAANPPGLATTLYPKIEIEPSSYMSILFLGSDATVCIRQYGTKQGSITVQHGDILGFKSGTEVMEISLRMENFGFFCIARHGKLNDVVPPQTATSESRLSIDSSLPHVHSDFNPSSSVEPLSATFPRIELDNIPVEDSSVSKSKDKKSTSARSKARAVSPPIVKPAELELKNWYIGAYPLDPLQPLRILPPYRPAEEDLDSTKVVILGDKKNWIQLEPRALSPLPGYDDLQPEPTPVQQKPAASNKKGKNTTSANSTPMSVTKKRGRGPGPRASVSGTPASTATADQEEDTRSIGGTPSARGGKRGRGRGRKSIN
ncbi:hypothetical protein V866_008622 [Kwoniella sp. B9012]